jgi:hypothetical protein
VSVPFAPGQSPAPYPPPPHQQAAPYPQAPQHGYAVPAPAYPQQVTQCRFCGCVPAVDVTFRGHRGMIVMMQFLHIRGPFCRDCGLSQFRDMTAKTLIQGWYGYASFIITPITVLVNLIRRGKVANLPQPVPPPQGAAYRRPLDPGPPLLARPTAVIGLAIPFVLLLLLVIVIALQSV